MPQQHRGDVQRDRRRGRRPGTHPAAALLRAAAVVRAAAGPRLRQQLDRVPEFVREPNVERVDRVDALALRLGTLSANLVRLNESLATRPSVVETIPPKA